MTHSIKQAEVPVTSNMKISYPLVCSVSNRGFSSVNCLYACDLAPLDELYW